MSTFIELGRRAVSDDADFLEKSMLSDGRLFLCDHVFVFWGVLGSDLPSGGNESSAMDLREDRRARRAVGSGEGHRRADERLP